MEHFNNKLFRMDLSIIPADIISVIGKYLLIGNNDKFKFNKIFRKKNDNKLLKFFFGLDENVFRYVNNYIGIWYKIECKEIYIKPLMDCINSTCNTQIKRIRLFYTPFDYFSKNTSLYINDNFKFYDKDNNRIDVCDIIVNNKHLETISDKLQSIREKWNIKKQLIEYDKKIQLIKDMNNVFDFVYWKDNSDDEL